LREDLFNLYFSHWGTAFPEGFLTQFRTPFDQAEGEVTQATQVYNEARKREDIPRGEKPQPPSDEAQL
jgi:hypothetical protein